MPRADWDRIFGHFKAQCEAEHEDVVALGGLHILGTERHEARRIDNQLRGRAGRQGDPGSSRFYLSLEDDLMRIFGSDRISGLMLRLGMEEGVPIEHGMVTQSIERAQRQVEAQNFAVRKHLLEYDDVMNKQREGVYTLRRMILEGKSDRRGRDVLHPRLPAGHRRGHRRRVPRPLRRPGPRRRQLEPRGPERALTETFGLDDDDYATVPFGTGKSAEIRDALWERVQAKYDEKEQVVPAEMLRHPARPACCRSSTRSGRTTSTRSTT